LELEDRLKVASLLYDLLGLERGFYYLQATEKNSLSYYNRNITIEEAEQQRVYFEGLAKQDPPPEFYIEFDATGDFENPLFTTSGSTVALHFAEFQSLAKKANIIELPWVRWLTTDIGQDPAIKKWIQRQTHHDMTDHALDGIADNSPVKKCVIEGLNRDLALAAKHGATISMDPFNFRLNQIKSHHLRFTPSLRELVLKIGLPSVTNILWDEIIDLRKEPGLKDLRRVVNEISAEIATLSKNADFELSRGEITNRWNRRIAGTIQELQPSLRNLAKDSVKSLFFDIVPNPGLGTIYGVVEGTKQIRQAKRSWLSVYMRLADTE
jgi:hypothetical protein